MNRFFGVAMIALLIGCLSFITKNDNLYEYAVDDDVEVGIEFQSLSLAEAKEMAQKTGKLIFIDVHASWCGPCKMMARGPFKEEKVAEKYNTNFINLKIDAEKDPDGEFVSRAYGVRAYPTLLFVNGKGKLVKRFVGYRSGDNLLGLADMVLPG